MRHAAAAVVALLAIAPATAQTGITVRADRPLHRVSRLLTGACLEDVNHEVYGGLYSQMLFGESFQEPPAAPVKGFTEYGGTWTLRDGAVWGYGDAGPRLSLDREPFRDGEVTVEVYLPDRRPGLAGLVLRASNQRKGADAFDGLEVSLDADAQAVRLGRHRQDWTHIADVPCRVPVARWFPLEVRLEGSVVEVRVDGVLAARHDEGAEALPAGTVALRPWMREAGYRNLVVRPKGPAERYDLAAASAHQVSGMWRPVVRGTALAGFRLDRERPFVGSQSQVVAFESGTGEVAVENRGLNRQGLSVRPGASYEVRLRARCETPAALRIALETGDGAVTMAERRLTVPVGGWREVRTTLSTLAIPGERPVTGCRFVVGLVQPGEVALGYALLQPGPWGRFRGLPVRRDVGEALVDQGVTLLRYGGSMVNHPEYRWKKMVGPRDLRPPTAGTWYPWSSNGWGIVDFLAFGRAAGIEAVPAVNMGETPQDLADFVQYANGPADTPWGRRRAEDGFPKPFGVRYIQLGNEERVDGAYAARFVELARAVWAADPAVTLVVGDFAYADPIEDPMRLTGTASGVRDMAGHRAILRAAREQGREVWFDVHVNTDGPGVSRDVAALGSYVRALDRLAEGAAHRVVVFEFNAGNHAHRRALANAAAIAECERLGVAMAASANCLQPDGHNDNGWDQGLLFLNPWQAWLQPPGWVTRTVSRAYQPVLLPAEVEGAPGTDLDVAALRSEDGRRLTLRVVNRSAAAVPCRIRLEGYSARAATAGVETLAAPLDARNTAEAPRAVTPLASRWRHGLPGRGAYTFAPHSFTVMQFR